jgi:hypothetical protein
MFDVAAAGKAIIFMSVTAGQIIVALYVLGYAAHCFLVILEETAAGNDEVLWPDVPIVDWVGKFFYLAWLAAFWFVPAWVLLDLLTPAVLTSFPNVPPFFILVGTVCLLFPISLFSSLSANSRWVVFRLEALRRWLRHLPSVFVFYCVTGVLLGGLALVCYFTYTDFFFLLPVVVLLGPAVLFIDARLLGRLAWLANFRTPDKGQLPEEPAEKAVSARDPWADPPEAAKPKKKKKAKKKASSAYDPWAVPEGEPARGNERAVSLPVEGYDLAEEDAPLPPRPTPAPRKKDEDEEEVLAMQPLPPEPTNAEGQKLEDDARANLTKVSEYEAALAGGGKEPDPPPYPLCSGVYNFPWYPRCVGPWLWLVFGSLVMGLLLKLQIATWPGG